MSVKRNVIAGWLSHLFTMLVGFFLMPYIVSMVGDVQYGAWILINALASYSGVIYGGFGATICRYVSDLSTRKEWDRLNRIVSSIQAVYVGTATLVFILSLILAGCAPYLSDWQDISIRDVRLSILIVGSSFALGMVGSVFGGVLVGTQRLDIKRGIEVTTGIMRLILVLTCLQQQFGLVTLALIFLAITLVDTTASWYFAHKQLPQLSVSPFKGSREALAECAEFTGFNAVALIAEYLIYYTDTVVIGIVLGPLAVTLYQIGQRITEMVRIPIIQIGEAVLPKAGELHAKQSRNELAVLTAQAMGVGLLLTAGVFTGVVYFGEIFITTWMGDNYPDSSMVLIVLLGSQIIALPMMIIRKSLLGMGLVRFPAMIDIVEAVANLALSLVLVRMYGIIGVAWGTLIPLILVELFIFLPYAAREVDISPSMLVQHVIAPQIPALAALLAFSHYASNYVNTPGWPGLIAVTVLGGGILVAVRWLTHIASKRLNTIGLNPEVAR